MKSRKETTALLHARSHLKYILILEGSIVGLLAGIVSIIYRILLGKSESFVYQIAKLVKEDGIYLIALFLFLFILGFIISQALKKEPFISGSGIPQVEAEVQNQIDQCWYRVLIAKIIGGTCAVLGGLSLGREGPSIQLGAMCGKGFSKIFRRIKVEQRYLITCGAAAGLSAAFNAPLAGILFALEEIHKNFSMSAIVSVMCASIMGDFLSQYVFGLEPALAFQVEAVLPLSCYGLIIVLGILCGVLGAGYNAAILQGQRLYEIIPFLKSHQRVYIPLLLSGFLFFVFPEVLCGGHHMTSLLDESMLLSSLFFLLIVKFLFSLCSFASGAPGGIFFPLLVLGCYIGAIFGKISLSVWMIDPIYFTNFVIIAMAGFFAGIVRAPITGIVLIAEMTGSLHHLLSLALVSIVAYVTAHFMKSKPIYESLLDRLLRRQGVDLEHGSEQKRLVEVVVEIGSVIENRQVKDIAWPSKCLLVGIHRGAEEVLPKGTTTINSGDTIIALLEIPGATMAEAELEELCKSG